MPKYYTSTCGRENGNFIRALGFEHTNKLSEADVIIFGGGADVDPATYGEEPGRNTWTSKGREEAEKKDFMEGLKLGKMFLGICRGQQLLCVLAGGKLIQDTSGHAGGMHTISTFDGLSMKTNSIHHQMINPYSMKNPKDFKILAWSTKKLSGRYLGAKDRSIPLPWDFKEIEAIYFPKIKGLGFQYHPEMLYGHKDQSIEPIINWTQNTFTKFFNGNL